MLIIEYVYSSQCLYELIYVFLNKCKKKI